MAEYSIGGGGRCCSLFANQAHISSWSSLSFVSVGRLCDICKEVEHWTRYNQLCRVSSVVRRLAETEPPLGEREKKSKGSRASLQLAERSCHLSDSSTCGHRRPDSGSAGHPGKRRHLKADSCSSCSYRDW
ncbi:uncharacterized protein LOC123987778 [Osmia bicornis bicornis]|uniref:uncharacterized protein LOC123987778 n=1 Tax=Osmia bicornis bicornis TaxID=1437191 RepID=UPI001EAF6A89|nr:uncharacterized protein LOC123987778 [Osmia bicornis bicornis]